MTLAGYLSEYSLAEIFNFVHKGNCTGLLSISPDPNSVLAPSNPHYLWFESGRIVAINIASDTAANKVLQSDNHRRRQPFVALVAFLVAQSGTAFDHQKGNRRLIGRAADGR